MDPLQQLVSFLQLVIVIAIVLALFAVAFLVIGYFFVKWWRYRKREEHSLDFVLMQVAVPRDNEIKIDAAEQMFASFYSIRRGGMFSFLRPQEHISFEIVAMPEDIRFYVSCPYNLKDMVEKQIHGAYPGADIREVDEHDIFAAQGRVAFTSLSLRSNPFYPVKTYKELPTDPLSSITSAMAKMQAGEGAAIQIMISPADNKWRAHGRSYVQKQKSSEAKGEGKVISDTKMLEAIEQKCSKAGFFTSVRIVTSSDTGASAKMHLANIRGAFEQFSSSYNSFKGSRRWFTKLPIIKSWFDHSFMIDFIYRFMPMFSSPPVLNAEELATLFHLPNKSVETPHIFWLNAKRAPAPMQIATAGLYLGKSVFRGIERPIYVGDDDRRRHMYVIGKTGTGKTEFLKSMILQDIKAGRGVAFIDPHGDAVDDILTKIPVERSEDVILFDPSDTDRPMGMNMLEANTEQQKHFVVTSIVGLMYKLYDPHQTGIIGPRFEHAIRNAMLTVMSEAGNTFVEVVRVLTDSSFVQELLPKVQDPVVRRYWTDQIAQTSDFHKSEVLDYIVSKFGRFVTNRLMRNIIGQSKSAFDLRKVMDERKILLINLSKGKIGEENSNFLGLVLVPKILIAAMSRQDMPETQRVDFYLYVDEFQNFATETFADILSEARKFRLNLIVANQFIGQMEENVKNAVFGNVGTLVAFRVGVSDGNYLQHEFQPVFSEADLINIDRFNAYIKTIVGGEPFPPFSMDTYRDLSREKGDDRIAEMIKELSRLRYGKDVNIIDAEITQRARL
ncbi:type IV secretion system DNA-binding domain-containing protein [Candidatus Daviesbacteria bacterium]|nr:type IV secretion system DNA-binding domain-containing protein [Candidatus Daviesbacteria bacterium]